MALFANKTEDKKNEKKDGSAARSVLVPAVLLSPRISEKSSHLATIGKYVFKVKLNANKVEIKKAVESSYKVKVTQVNIVRMEGKSRNYGRTSGRTQDFKKAIVTLKAGDKIEGITEVA